LRPGRRCSDVFVKPSHSSSPGGRRWRLPPISDPYWRDRVSWGRAFRLGIEIFVNPEAQVFPPPLGSAPPDGNIRCKTTCPHRRSVVASPEAGSKIGGMVNHFRPSTRSSWACFVKTPVSQRGDIGTFLRPSVGRLPVWLFCCFDLGPTCRCYSHQA